jgi:MFS family permease
LISDRTGTEVVARSAAIYLGVVQFFFATTWTIYVIYLPQLAAKAGIAAQWIAWILVADQAVFAVTDVMTGFWVDRVRAGLARFGGWILGITMLSCAAFLLLPFAGGSPGLLLVAILVWAVTSAVLRSPPWVLLSRYAAKPSVPWLSTLVLTGSALASAMAPYLGVALRDADPRVPFVLSTLTLLATVAGLVWIERRLAGADPRPAGETEPPFELESAEGRRLLGVFFASLVVMAVGFQVHSSLNSAPQYLRFAGKGELQYLMPVFWIGFNVLMFPAARLVKRVGAFGLMAGGAALGALATLCAVYAPGIQVLVVAQFVAGGCWGAMLVGVFTAAVAFGRTQRQGAVMGTMFAVLSFGGFVRIGAVASNVAVLPAMREVLPWLPLALWLIAALMLAALLGTARRRAL